LAPAGETADEQDLGFDLDLTPPPEAPAPSSELPEEVKGLDLDLDLDLEGMADAAPTEERPVVQAATELDDLSSLEVDEGSGADPLETKLSLAREFEAIGDTDARAPWPRRSRPKPRANCRPAPAPSSPSCPDRPLT